LSESCCVTLALACAVAIVPAPRKTNPPSKQGSNMRLVQIHDFIEDALRAE
jgi:hypothetical protein